MARTEGNEIRGILVEITERNYIESFSLAKIYIFMAIVKDFHVKMRLASFCWHIVKHGLDWICKTQTGFVKHGFVKHGFVKHGFVKGGLSFFVKYDCLTVYLFISVCPFLILILLLYIIFILCYRFTFK